MLHPPRGQHASHARSAVRKAQRLHGEEDAGNDQQRGEAAHQLVGVSLRVGRERLDVHHPEEKLAIEHAELPLPHFRIRSANSRETASVSCSTASCEKISSSVGRDISSRRRSMESSRGHSVIFPARLARAACGLESLPETRAVGAGRRVHVTLRAEHEPHGDRASPAPA